MICGKGRIMGGNPPAEGLAKLSLVEKSLEPFERMLLAQEDFRKRIGVKRVDRPTYERYIIGPVQKIDWRRNAFLRIRPENPYGGDFPERYKAQTDRERDPSELEVDDRIALSLRNAVWRICREYHLASMPVASETARVPVENPTRMSRLIKKVSLFLGASLVGITKVDQRWVYEGIDIPEKYAIMFAVPHYPSLLNYLKLKA